MSKAKTAPKKGMTQKHIDENAQARNNARIAVPETTGATVTVGLKAPHGVQLRLQIQEEVSYPVLGGGVKNVKEMRPHPDAKIYVIHGTDVPFGEAPRCLIIGGYAMTPGIPRDFMELWLEQNKRHDLVVNGLLIVHEQLEDAKAEARENRDLRSGLEPITPNNDPRLPKKPDRDGKLVNAIETGDEQPKAAA